MFMLQVFSCACGVFLADESGNIVQQHAFPRDAESVSRIMLDLKNAASNAIIDELLAKILDYIKANVTSSDIVEIEDEFLYQYMQGRVNARLFLVKSSKAGSLFRSDVQASLAKLKDSWTLENFLPFNRAVNLELTKLQIKSVSEQNDRLIMQAVNSIDDINKSTNIFSERIREWYGFHFPELTDQLIADHEFFLEIINAIGTRGEFTPERIKALRPVNDKTIEIMVKRAKESMGGEFSPYDIKTVQAFAKSVLDLYKTRVEIENYVESLMEQTCPNLSAIVGPLLGARLICLAGGLEPLAKKPSSTIQVLGAEKALFRAIKTHGEPPKHGILFQAKEVRTAPFWQRGKIARLMAGKISIAVRVDQVSKRYIADELIIDISKKIAEIQRKYPEKPAQKKERPSAERQERPSRPGTGRSGGPPSHRYGQKGFKQGGGGGGGRSFDRGAQKGFKQGGGGGGGGKPGKKYPPKGRPRSSEG